MTQHQTEITSTSNQDDIENAEQTTVTTESISNPDFENLVGEATRTKEQERIEQREEKAQDAPTALTHEKATEFTLGALDQFAGVLSQFTGKQIELPDMAKGLFAILVSPCVMKYGDTVQRLMKAPKQIDLDSKVPEGMAALGIAGMGYFMYQQIAAPQTNSKPAEQTEQTEQSAEHGDK
ncbi:hypothetical protein [Catenovulum agarivorans]|uniref:hypothetical protein n=1 Tax=Catenovulum agarivorans TaxID=1172192 RepID=UPI0002DCA94A|nr:hypothetical protein [Catenovulum agarivorans]